LLEVERTADDATIKSPIASWRCNATRIARTPAAPKAEAKFKAISEAYDCLKDPQKRAAYDRFGHAAFEAMVAAAAVAAPVFPTLATFSKRSSAAEPSAAAGASRQRRGADLRYDLEITLEEAFPRQDAEISIEVSAL
jgi:molecular chaperone DnaJ